MGLPIVVSASQRTLDGVIIVLENIGMGCKRGELCKVGDALVAYF
jgi:hypothetical protein